MNFSVLTKSRFLILLLTLCAMPLHPLQSQVIRVDCPTYCSMYDIDTMCPIQVQWTLHAADMGHAKRMPGWKFINDVSSAGKNVLHADYNHSGYDRGHLCPAQDRSKSAKLMRSTFAMSNCAPQVPALNRGTWKQTENSCRLAASIYDSVCVLVMPVFLNRDTLTFGEHGMRVPHAFFKAAWVADTDSVIYSWFFFNHE